MGGNTRAGPSRRKVIAGFAATRLAPTTLAGLAPAVVPSRARAKRKTLRILRWKHFVPGYETWFNDVFVREWAERNDTEVIVDSVGFGDISRLVNAEAQAGEGHDLVEMGPRPSLEDHFIDHREIFEECRSRYGAPAELIVRSFQNPRTNSHHGIGTYYTPFVLTFRHDLWEAVGHQPTTWDAIRKGGRAIKLLHGAPVGISLAPEHNAEHSLRAIMSAFGSSIQDADDNPALGSPATLEALKFTKALYEEAMTDEVLSWRSPSNNAFMLSGAGSLTLDTMSIIRAAESKSLPVDPKLSIASLPDGPSGKTGPNFGVGAHVIWRFAQNIEGAQKFIVDFVGRSEEAFIASGFQIMPSFPGAVPRFAELVGAPPYSPGRYSVLADVPAAMTNLGSPGFTNAATEEVMNSSIVATMFARTATGAVSAEDAMTEADQAVRAIFERWRAAGKI